jgi:hypothetical protein
MKTLLGLCGQQTTSLMPSKREKDFLSIIQVCRALGTKLRFDISSHLEMLQLRKFSLRARKH